jgi:hypothetical protein
VSGLRETPFPEESLSVNAGTVNSHSRAASLRSRSTSRAEPS